MYGDICVVMANDMIYNGLLYCYYYQLINVIFIS